MLKTRGRWTPRHGCTVVLAVGLTLLLPACSHETKAETSNAGAIRVDLNVYTPGTIPQGIGEPVKAAREVADEWEKLHPGEKVQYQQLVNTGNSEGEWLKTQLIGGVAPEIINMNAEVAWPDVGKGWYVPLDEYLQRPNPYVPGNKRWMDVFSNQALVNAKRAPDGKLYCISIDIVETGIFYNKDILANCGIAEVPQTWQEMMDTLRKVDEHGYIPFTADFNLASDWGQDIIFEMLYHDIMPEMDLIQSSSGSEAYMGHYLEPAEAGFLFTKGFFTHRDPRWREMNRLLLEWRRYQAKELKNTDPVRLFLTQRLAMYWSGSWFIRRITTDPYVNFNWGITYIPAITKATSPYASGTPATVIGGAAVQLHVTDSALINHNLDACIDYLMYLTAPQNLQRLTSEALVYIPNVKGAHMEKQLEPFREIFQRKYCAVKWLESMDGRYKKDWRRMLDYYLNDGMDLDQFMAVLEQNFSAWVESHRNDKAWDFTKMEAVWKTREDRLERELEH